MLATAPAVAQQAPDAGTLLRAYPVNQAIGDDGFLATAELRYQLPHGLRLFGFYDIGGIQVNQHSWSDWQQRVGEPNTCILQGAGAGIGWAPVAALHVSVTYAHAIGTNPTVDVNGNNADGGTARDRVWAQGVWFF